jgi:hypothetical protein
MPKKSYAKQLDEWESLLEGLKTTAPHSGHIAFIQALLTEAIREARETRKRQETLSTAKRENHKRLEQIFGRGHDVAMRARSYLRYRIGPYNDELTRFGLNPIRRGAARKKACPPVVEEEAV